MNVLINNYLTLQWHCFNIKRVKCMPGNKTSTNKPPYREFYAEKIEKMGYFQFFRFLQRFAFI